METGIRVEAGDVAPESIKAIVEGAREIFKTGQKTHMDQETIRCALQLVKEVAVVKETTIRDCVISGDQVAPNDE